jgi:type II secretory pathway pseudopilin PulG
MTTPPQGARADSSASTVSADSKQRQPTLLEQMGGVSGLIYSSVPVLVFVLVNALLALQPAIWAALGSAALITVVRLVRKQALQPAISGFFGVAIAAFIAYRTGSAKGFFLFGIWASLVYGGVFALSVVVRWPLAGVIWTYLNGHRMTWRADRRALIAYDIATLSWVAVFGARFIVQRWLYDEDQTGWLAFARIAMGYPLTAVALAVTVWAVRRAGHRVRQLEQALEDEEHAIEARLRAKYSGEA